MTETLILGLIDKAVQLGGALGAAILTAIEGSGQATEKQRQMAADAKARLASSTASLAAYREEIRQNLRDAQLRDPSTQG